MGNTPLHIAAWHSSLQALACLCDCSGALELRNKVWLALRSAFLIATYHHSPCGFPFSYQSQNCETAADIAERLGHSDAVGLLKVGTSLVGFIRGCPFTIREICNVLFLVLCSIMYMF